VVVGVLGVLWYVWQSPREPVSLQARFFHNAMLPFASLPFRIPLWTLSETLAMRIQRATMDLMGLVDAKQCSMQLVSRGLFKFTPKHLEDRESKELALLYVHGGGHIVGSLKAYKGIVSMLASHLESSVFFVDYDLAPEHGITLVDQTNQVIEAIQLLRSQLGFKKIVLIGDSAGGKLVILAAQRMLVETPSTPIAAVVALSPFLITNRTVEDKIPPGVDDRMLSPGLAVFFNTKSLGTYPPDSPLVNVFKNSFKGFPPLLVHAGTIEFLRQDSLDLVELARKQGVRVEFLQGVGMGHIWFTQAPFIPEATQAVDNIKTFLDPFKSA